MATKTILSTIPGNGFPVVSGPGSAYSGGAVNFKVNSQFSLQSVSVWLLGYTGANGQRIALQLLDSHQSAIGTFTAPPPNDGTLSSFTYTTQGFSLQAGSSYWLLLYGAQVSGSQISGAAWVGGGLQPSGDAIFIQSQLFQGGAFSDSSIIPQFAINAIIVPPPANLEILPPSN